MLNVYSFTKPTLTPQLDKSKYADPRTIKPNHHSKDNVKSFGALMHFKTTPFNRWSVDFINKRQN